MRARFALAVTNTNLLIFGATVVAGLGTAQTRRGDVTESRVIAEAGKGDNWLVGGRTFDEQHFSPLKQVTDQNIGNLGLAWAADIESTRGWQQSRSS